MKHLRLYEAIEIQSDQETYEQTKAKYDSLHEKYPNDEVPEI